MALSVRRCRVLSTFDKGVLFQCRRSRVRRTRAFRQRHNVKVMQEDPEDFFGDVGDFLTPEFVWSRDMHAQNEGHGSVRFGFLGLSKVCEDLACSLL